MAERALPGPVQARQHGRNALRLWRRHKCRAALLAVLALCCLAVWGARRAAGMAGRAVRNLRQEKERNQ